MKNQKNNQRKSLKRRITTLAIFMLVFGIFSSCSNEETVITDLTVNYVENPVGIEKSDVTFSWKMESSLIGQGQENYRIVVSDLAGNQIWNSGTVESGTSVSIPYEGPELDLETRYNWNVTVGATNGAEITSATAFFETGTEFTEAEWIHYKPEAGNFFESAMQIDVTPTILENGFTLYFGMKNENNRFAWNFTDNSLTATKEGTIGTTVLEEVNLRNIISANVPFNLSILVTDESITTTINQRQVSVINHNYLIERPYVSLMAAEAQTNRRTQEITSPRQSAAFEDFTLTVDGQEEQVGEAAITLTAPEPDPSAGGGFRRGGPAGVIFLQETFQDEPIEFEEEKTTMPLFRTEHELNGDVESARLYISALGVFDAFINGREVKQIQEDGTELDDILSPGWTNYNDYLYYRTYDATPYLDGNTIVLGASVGTGWYAGLIGRDYYHEIGEDGVNELALIAKLVINYEDGSQDVVVTNTEDWLASDDGPMLLNDIFIGEIYDARLEANVEGWNDVGFDDSGWESVSLLADYNPQLIGGDENTAYLLEELRINPQATEDTYIFDPENIDFSTGLDYGSVVREPVDPADEIRLEPGKKLMVDMGQNIAGVTGISVSGPEGTEIRMRGAEMLNDGNNNPNHESGAGSSGPEGTLYWAGLTRENEEQDDWFTDVYYLNNEEVQDYRASFTFHGYRYLEVSADDEIVIHDIYAQPMTSVKEQTGTIVTNNEDINQLHRNTLWSQMGNHITIPTDCPNRAERLGWSGDITVFAETALYNFDAVNFMNNYMEIASNYADNNDGRLGTTMPGPSRGAEQSGGGFGGGGRTNAGWTDVGIILTWALYQQTGDMAVLEENYDLLAAYMDEVMVDGLRAGYGDWVALQETSGDYMAGVYQAYDAIIMAKMAEVVGNMDDARKYQAEYERMRDFLAEKYVDEDSNLLSVSADSVTSGGFMSTGIIQDNSQTSILWALKMGLYDSEEEKETFIRNLLTNIDNENESIRSGQGEKTLSTGFLGVNVLLPVLTENGLSSSAYDLLLQDEMPSWLYEVQQGATTTWERWNAYSHVNSFEDNGMNSFNHYAYGAVAEWMFEYMAGIQKDEKNPGFKNIILQPIIDNGIQFNDQERIKEVTGEYESYYGTIVSEWTAEEGNLESYEATIPANTTATLYLPLDDSLTEDAVNSMEAAPGVSYVGITTRNNVDVAQFELASGGYNFEAVDGRLAVELKDGYTVE